MKKFKKHIFILILLLLIGVLCLSIGTSAESIPWLPLFGSSSSTHSLSSAAESAGTKSGDSFKVSELNTADVDTRILHIAPINTSSGIAHVSNTADNNASSVPDSGEGVDAGDGSGNTGISAGESGSFTPIVTGTITGSSGRGQETGSTVSSSPSSGTSSEAPVPAKPDPGSSSSQTPSSSGSSSSESSGSTENSGSGGIPSHHHHHHRTVAVTGVTLDKTSAYLEKPGDTVTLKATAAPEDTTQSKSVTWSSSDSTIAAVDRNGKVTAVKGGKAEITAKTVNGKTAVCNVTVRIPAAKVTLNLENKNIEMEKGSSLVLAAVLEPADTTDGLTWATSDSNIVTVGTDGKITAVNAGTATITAKAGDISVECKVTVGISISTLELSETDLSLKKGENKTLTATVNPPDTTEDKTVTWTSSDSKVAAVDKDGKITAVEGGTAIITAQAEKHTAQCTVTVTVPVSGISFEKDDITLNRGTSQTLKPVIAPKNATDQSLDWVSSDETVASVTMDGKVTAVGAGQAIITAKTNDGGFTAHCKVTVVVSISKVQLDKDAVTLKKGESTSLTATVFPADTTEDKTVTWTSSDETVATVGKDGSITAVEGGTAVITATAGTKKESAQCKVTVIVPTTGISLDHDTLTLAKGTESSLKAIFQPADATDTGITWISDNPDIVSVDDAGTLKALKTGTAVISAASHDGGFKAQCKVTVVIPVTGITLDKTSLELVKGKTQTLTAVITPEDATDKGVAWTSSNSSIASVDSAGKVTAVGGGSATITVTSHDGGLKAVCSITVTVPVTGISLDKTKLSLMPNAAAKLTATINPQDATDRQIIWASSNPALVTVDQQGNIKMLGKIGSATVTATSHDGGYKASCTVLAMIHVKGISLDQSSMTLYKYDSKYLRAIFSPSDATDKSVTWSSSDTSVAQVGSTGSVYGRGYGTATITATSRDGGYRASCTVTVHGRVQAKLRSTFEGSYIHEDGTFSLAMEAGTSKHTSQSEEIENGFTLYFNHTMNYIKDEPVLQIHNLHGWYERYGDYRPRVKVYVGKKLIAYSGDLYGTYDRDNKDYNVDQSSVVCPAISSGSFNKVTIIITGDFEYGNVDWHEAPAPGGFKFKTNDGIIVCESRIENIEVLK